MSQSILKMEQIVKSFGAVNVLKGIDFDLAKGEVHDYDRCLHKRQWKSHHKG